MKFNIFLTQGFFDLKILLKQPLAGFEVIRMKY